MSKKLVAFVSASGTTKIVAEMIAEEVKADFLCKAGEIRDTGDPRGCGCQKNWWEILEWTDTISVMESDGKPDHKKTKCTAEENTDL